MSDAPWQPPDRAELLSRIAATDTDQLKAGAATLERAADHCQQLTGRMRGIRAGVPDSWTHGGVEAFLKYSSELIYNLAESANAIRTMAGHLREHATAAEEARGYAVAAGGLAAAQKYSPHPNGESWDYQTDAIERFHSSEQRVRQALWKFGEIAPGRIPLPQSVPLPKLTDFWSKIDPPEIGDQYWMDKDLDPHPATDVYDERHKLYGYDEDGNLVPAFMADPMRQQYVEGGIPIRGILQLLRIGGRTFETVEELSSVLKSEVRASPGFRDAHIDKHIREFYYRGKKPLDELPKSELPEVTPAQREEFLDFITQAMMRSEKVHAYRTGDTQTDAVLFHIRDRNQWLLVQFRRDNGAFSTAFEPNPSKLLGLLQKMHIR